MGHRARQMVWQLLEFSLQYLQIDALRKPVTPAVSAETSRGRATHWQSGALARARFANEYLRDASAHRLRVSKGEYIPSSDSASTAARIADGDS